jgi:hypothetical protein
MLVVDVGVNSKQSLQDSFCYREKIFGERNTCGKIQNMVYTRDLRFPQQGIFKMQSHRDLSLCNPGTSIPEEHTGVEMHGVYDSEQFRISDACSLNTNTSGYFTYFRRK